MKYNYREGLQKQRSRKWLVVPLFALLLCGYAAVVVFAPVIYYVIDPADRTAKHLTTEKPGSSVDRLYIPKINATVPIVPIETGEAAALSQGVIQRATTSGNPKEGGTYVLAAHRLELGLTPRSTYHKSPFYHLTKVSVDDDVYVDYKGSRYAYKITSITRVDSNAPSLEERSDTVQLRLYTADQERSTLKRDVVSAKLVGKVIWVNGQPKLQSL